MYLEIFLADFAVFRFFLGISWDFAGPRPREISEALILTLHLGYFRHPLPQNQIWYLLMNVAKTSATRTQPV